MMFIKNSKCFKTKSERQKLNEWIRNRPPLFDLSDVELVESAPTCWTVQGGLTHAVTQDGTHPLRINLEKEAFDGFAYDDDAYASGLEEARARIKALEAELEAARDEIALMRPYAV